MCKYMKTDKHPFPLDNFRPKRASRQNYAEINAARRCFSDAIRVEFTFGRLIDNVEVGLNHEAIAALALRLSRIADVAKFDTA